MTGFGHSVGERVESEVRERYLGWAGAGTSIVNDLANRTARTPIWPDNGQDDTRRATLTRTTSDLAGIETARQRGWLISQSAESNPREGALSGLAVAVKDNIDVAGLPTRNGTPRGQWRTPTASAPVWDALEGQGAWCAGKSRMHEMAWGVTTTTIPGPVDDGRITGGSSGGSAAVVAVGATRAALATDTGGSIRIPAALCGVVGLRPTQGATSTTGITALAPAQDVVGPIAENVETAALIFEILANRAIMPANDGVRGQRIGRLSHLGRIEPSVEEGYWTTLSILADSGAILVDVDTVLPRLTASVSLLRMLFCADALYGDLVRRDPLGYGPEARALLTLGAELALDMQMLDRAAEAVKAETADVFTCNALDVLITPTSPCVAPKRSAVTVEIGGRQEHVDAALTRYTPWAAVAGLPALSVPVQTPGPLPVGIQIMAPPGREDACIRTALAIERFTPKRKGGQ